MAAMAVHRNVAHGHHTKDSDSSSVNRGMYRLMVHDRNTLACLFPLQQHIGQMYQEISGDESAVACAVAIGGQLRLTTA
jgi:UbiD family decarboxylase